MAQNIEITSQQSSYRTNPEICRKCPEIANFLSGASLSCRVLSKQLCVLAQSANDLYT